MELNQAASIFTTLGHPDRLAILRLLMRFAPRGQRPTEIAQILGIKQNTLSHHLGELASAGLISVIRQGRSLFYSVNLDMTEGLIGYLALDVGRGRADLLPPLLSRQTLAKVNETLNVLFLCSGNSARSIMAEALLRDLGKGRFTAYSAGIQPALAPHPKALQILREGGHNISDLRSKNISEFQHTDAPQMDIVITVCDRAAARDCPPWTGHPLTAHWGLSDPAHIQGCDDRQADAFSQTYLALRYRLTALVALPVSTLDWHTLQTRIDAIDASALIKEKA